MYYDRVLDTTTTTGTGPWTLADVELPTFRRPSDVLSNGDTILGVLEAYDDDGTPLNEWIAGVFQYASSGPTLTALEIYSGSNGTSAVNFSAGVKRFMSAEPAARIGPTVSDGKDADARPTYPRTNDLYIVTDTGAVQRYDGSSWVTIATSNTGTVTSVGLSMPNLFAVDKSPVTTSGTIAVTLSSQTKATFLAAPTAEDGAPTFRAIAAGDLPSTVAFQNATNTFQSLQTFQKAIAGANGSGTTSIDLNYLGSFAILYVASAGHFFTDSLFVDQNISANNVVAEGVIAGDGSLIIGLDASNISFGTLNAARLATSGVTAATYGSATASPEIAVDKYGRITAAANKTITPSWGNLVSVPANVDALGNLVSVADSIGYFAGSGTMSLATFTSFARNLLDDADAATARSTLGATTVGGNTFTQTNPSAVGFNRVNADNTLTHRTPPQVVADINVVVTESGGTGTISDSTHRGRTVLFTDDTPEWEAPTGLTEGFICSLFPPIGKTLELTAGAGATVQAAGTTVGQNGAVLFWVAANTYRLSGDVS